MKIDILGMELEKGLPYWLSPEAKLSHKIADIRKKHRDKHLAKLAQDRALARDDYNPQEARVGKGEEGGGQWTKGGANPSKTTATAAVAPAATEHEGQVFASPNMKTLKFSTANSELSGPRQKLMKTAFHSIAQTLAITSEQYDALGAWRDGAENSIMSEIAPTSFDKIKVAGAMMGALAHQKSVLVFQTGGGDGKHFMAHFCAEGDMQAIHHKLLDMGLAFHTLIPYGGKVHVYVYGSDAETRQAANDAGKAYGSPTEIQYGQGEFVGSAKDESEPDDAIREDAQHAYEDTIRQYAAGQSGGQDFGKNWKRLRDRWVSIGRPAKNVKGQFAKSYGDKDAKAKLFEWQTGANDRLTNIDDVVRSGIENQKHLAAVGVEIAKSLKGVQFKDPGAKVWDKKTNSLSMSGVNRVLEKAKTRGLGGVTDVARLGFVVSTPQDRDAIISGLRKHFNVVDEGYQRNDWGYYDAKALVQFDDGMIGEIQIMEKNLANAKSSKGEGGGGHKLYDSARELPESDPKRQAIMEQSRKVYRNSLKTAHPSWKSIYESIPFRPG